MADAGFAINGEVYEVPSLVTFDMDEAQILYDLSGVVIEDFVPAHPDLAQDAKDRHEAMQIARLRKPGLKRALVHVAYRRKHPDYDFAALDEAIGKLNALDVVEAVLTRGGDDVDPSMSSPKQPDEKNSTSETSPQSSSGSPSGSDSAGQVVSLARTGHGRSDTSSPPSDQATLASAS